MSPVNKTIEIVPHDACTACGACMNKCPVDAISMEIRGGISHIHALMSRNAFIVGCAHKRAPSYIPTSLTTWIHSAMPIGPMTKLER